MALKLNFPFSKTVGNAWQSVSNLFYEVRLVKGYDDSLKCNVMMISDKLHASIYKGITNEAGDLLFIPSMMRVFTDTHPFYLGGKKMFIVSNEYHGTINMLDAKKRAEALSYSLTADLQKGGVITTIKVKDIDATISPFFFDNEYSLGFSSDSYRILQTKSLEFLSEYSNRQYIMTAIIAALVGMIFGFIMAAMGIGMIVYFGN